MNSSDLWAYVVPVLLTLLTIVYVALTGKPRCALSVQQPSKPSVGVYRLPSGQIEMCVKQPDGSAGKPIELVWKSDTQQGSPIKPLE